MINASGWPNVDFISSERRAGGFLNDAAHRFWLSAVYYSPLFNFTHTVTWSQQIRHLRHNLSALKSISPGRMENVLSASTL